LLTTDVLLHCGSCERRILSKNNTALPKLVDQGA